MIQKIINGDCKEVMRRLKESSVDSIITDPPYELGFMGKKWDSSGVAYSVDVWREALRVLKPGGHLLAFGGSRTYHRMACAIEDAGFEIRDQIMWLYGSGFPKSLDVSKAIDKLPKGDLVKFSKLIKKKRIDMGLSVAQADDLITGGSTMYSFLEGRNVNGEFSVYPPNKKYYEKIVSVFGISGWESIIEDNLKTIGKENGNFGFQKSGERWKNEREIKISTTNPARQWSGFGTALKPAHEPIVVARKPLSEKTVAENVLTHGTGALNIDGCRVDYMSDTDKSGATPQGRCTNKVGALAGGIQNNRERTEFERQELKGRWPANVIHDGSDEVTGLFPQTKSGALNAGHKRGSGVTSYDGGGGVIARDYGNDSGSAARFFYCAKANKTDRGEGNNHPTVKPTDLMRYLCRLVTPPNGVILDPFCGSGSTGKAAGLEGFHFVGIEKEEKYCEVAKSRFLGQELQ